MLNHRKAAVIGCGFVGSACAFSLIQRGLFSELVLIDANQDKAVGEAMDLSHGLPYIAAMDVHAGSYDDLSDCALIVVTAGANQKPGQTRLELIGQNVSILNSIIPQITARPFEGILLIVSNPVDVLTYAAWKISGYPRERVIGSGTVLDTGRLKQLLGEELRVDSRNVHAFIVGEHGDSELAVWSEANVSGLDLEDFCRRAAALPNLCPHFHLSLQSGCDGTLVRMNRKYDTKRYYESVQLLREYFRSPGITTDLITGFPGETEEEFAATLEFIRSCGFAEMHIFPYSRRPGTPAAEMEQTPRP